MIFFSKGPESKAEQVAANKERDRRVRAHLLHMESSKEAAEGNKSTGKVEISNPEEGIDEDIKGQVGRQAQLAKEIIAGRAKQLGRMRAQVRLGRRRARVRGKSLGL